MGDTISCGVISSLVNRHSSRHGKLGPQEGRELVLVYTIQKAPADNGTLRRGTTSDERKGRPCWRLHCPDWWSNSQENMQINYLQRLTRKLRLALGVQQWTDAENVSEYDLRELTRKKVGQFGAEGNCPRPLSGVEASPTFEPELNSMKRQKYLCAKWNSLADSLPSTLFIGNSDEGKSHSSSGRQRRRPGHVPGRLGIPRV